MKVSLGDRVFLYPMPITIVGATVNGKPNFITIAHVGILNFSSLSIGMNKIHYTNTGIKENRTFSVNIPSEDLVKETDYCGLISGRNEDKGGLFDIFYGTLERAPMIKACPVNMECRLINVVDFPKHDVFVGEIVETHCDEQCLTNGVLDILKVRPILFSSFEKQYWKLGEPLAKAWNIGKELKKKK